MSSLSTHAIPAISLLLGFQDPAQTYLPRRLPWRPRADGNLFPARTVTALCTNHTPHFLHLGHGSTSLIAVPAAGPPTSVSSKDCLMHEDEPRAAHGVHASTVRCSRIWSTGSTHTLGVMWETLWKKWHWSWVLRVEPLWIKTAKKDGKSIPSGENYNSKATSEPCWKNPTLFDLLEKGEQ